MKIDFEKFSQRFPSHSSLLIFAHTHGFVFCGEDGWENESTLIKLINHRKQKTSIKDSLAYVHHEICDKALDGFALEKTKKKKEEELEVYQEFVHCWYF